MAPTGRYDVGFSPIIGLNRPGIDSGNEIHFEWAVGYEVTQGLVIGVVGYDWRQISGDSGAGASLGDFEGRIDAIGPGLSYTTLIGKMPLTVNLRHYEEYAAERKLSGSLSVATVTVKF